MAIAVKGFLPDVIPLLVFAYGLTAAAIVDHEHMILPDSIVQPLLWSGLIYVAVTAPRDLQWHVLGAAVGYCLLRWLPRVGEGDAKLCATAGAWLGLTALPTFLMISGGLGVASALIYFWFRRKSSACPFGPPMVLAALVIMTSETLGLPPSIVG
ncbi:A24 family peptidase [Pseudomonas sp. W22_MBD1_FP4]|uniref:prepilin peptidase n=1 Tax=Pseudomonas sp. W22_MBD1_FP4 TaxID=3240272 RepID=UPI003F98AC7D